MKRREIVARLEAAGLTLVEGGNHTRIYRGKVYLSAIPRHREIDDRLVRAIAKQTGVELN